MPTDRERFTTSRPRSGPFERLARSFGAQDQLPIDPDLAPDDAGEPSPDHRRGPRTRRAHPGVLAVIFVGGFIGTAARDAVERAWPTPIGHFPAATFVINTSGAFLLGLVLSALLERRRPGTHLRPFLATGLLGGWTTYSTLVLEAVVLGKHHDAAAAAGYLAISLVAGVSAVALGIALGRSRGRPGVVGERDRERRGATS